LSFKKLPVGLFLLFSRVCYNQLNFMETVQSNSKVKVHYKGTLNDGSVFDSSHGKEPLEFTMGQGQLIKGFEAAVLGMKPEETRTVDIPSAEAYGPVVDDLKQEVKRDVLPEDLKPEVGMQLVSQQPGGQQIPVKIIEVADETITVDANHPLAGKDLTFEIQLVEIVE
jgi:FKBP-type peptidyl-prolyl cis-trans isomerase 2